MVLHNNNYNGLGVLRGQRHILKKNLPDYSPPPPTPRCNQNKTLEKLLGKYYDPKIRLSILFAL